MSSVQKWPGFGQDGEAGRMQQERAREREIQAANLSARKAQLIARNRGRSR